MPKIALNKTSWLLFSLLYLVLLAFGQIFLKREAFVAILFWQVLLHILLFIFYKFRSQISIQHIVIFAIVARVIAAFLLPTLSDDVYRFIWDGQLIVTGNNPMLSTPNDYLASLSTTTPHLDYWVLLHSKINHPQFYTCYPPLMQGIFWIGAFLGSKSIVASIVIIKLIIAAGDMLAVYFLYRLLVYFKLDEKLLVLYALHPLVIIEGAGNAHFEVVQVALLLGSIFYLFHKKMLWAALFWAFAIITKLVPLMLLPLCVRYLGFKKSIQFIIIVLLIVIVTFLPFVSEASINGFSKSLNLYFQNFEFNASIYYVAREIGWWFKGYNYISFIGPFLMLLFLSIYAFIYFKNKQLTDVHFLKMIIVVFTLYYLFATTVHPWYIINLFPLAILTNKKYVWVWVSAAFLSYNAYGNTPFHENVWLIVLEYASVLAAYIYFDKHHVKA